MTPLPPPLDTLDAEECATLGGYLTPATYDADERIVTAGEPGDGCLFIDGGVARLEAPHDHLDTDVTLGYLSGGEVLGELSLLDAGPRSLTAVAEEPVVGRWLRTDGLAKLADDHPGIAVHVLQALGRDTARKLRATNERLTDFLAQGATDEEVEALVAAAKDAQRALAAAPEATVEAMLADLAEAFADNALRLAEAAVAETRIGNVRDKAIKNAFAARGVQAYGLGKAAVGPLGDPQGGVTEVGAPVGVVFAIIPLTNPVATAYFKVLAALKSRNALILSFHRRCLPLAEEVGAITREVLSRHGLPAEAIGWVRERSSRMKTAMFMRHPDVSLVLATGGPGMVRAAYSSGTPAIGVGSGNAPCWVAADADIAQAAAHIVASKSFDNGLICGAEHNLVVDVAVADRLTDALEGAGAAVLDPDEVQRFLAAVITEDGTGFQPAALGQDAATIAAFTGITRDHPITLIVFPTEPDLTSPVTSEKMSPFVSMFTVDGDDAAIALSQALLAKMGAGHTAIVHATARDRIDRWALEIPASRILVNSPGSQGVCGLTTGLAPSLTLGCGTFGGNSTGDNVTFTHLRNVKRMAEFVEPDLSMIAVG